MFSLIYKFIHTNFTAITKIIVIFFADIPVLLKFWQHLWYIDQMSEWPNMQRGVHQLHLLFLIFCRWTSAKGARLGTKYLCCCFLLLLLLLFFVVVFNFLSFYQCKRCQAWDGTKYLCCFYCWYFCCWYCSFCCFCCYCCCCQAR